MIKLGRFEDKQDGSLKSVFASGENAQDIVEMTLLFNRPGADVVCAPTHHFCNLGCKMCHLTDSAITKSMHPILADAFIDCLIKTVTKADGTRITGTRKLLISFMGVGEPLLNLSLIENIYQRENEIKEALGYNEISYALATMMPMPLDAFLVMQARTKIPLKVHFSLHSPLDDIRSELIPASSLSVEQAIEELGKYATQLRNDPDSIAVFSQVHTTCQPVEIHYTLIDGVNDSDEELSALISLFANVPMNIPIKFIAFNPKDDMRRSPRETEWIDCLREARTDARVRTYCPPGGEIGSSCGEFTKHYYHEEIETPEQLAAFEQWKSKHEVFI